ncbi:DNA-binding transcriptional LysR family regulator [Caulobacter ginsengisoli]|uniref:DNA-binding transcriptional LysR family regulator n=1 Tax=Caulobacter ginsengisoli TaxID=400775 RepID=A0ABU0INE0_9CAUL|nr:LysR family transcriptional regulator [Caulobacter ginsengisoli]MDQ0463474.1 DNA-binding transcriptional LysR family regulator [Caulobacter ginsengisoli]
MDRLDPRALEAFQAVVETGSATLAAQKLHQTQPTITRAIAQLEQQTGLTLFDRGRFGMRPTAEGLLLAEEIRRSFVGLERLAASAQAIRGGLRGQIVVTAMPVYGEGFVTRALARLAAGAPDVQARVELDAPPDAVRKVLSDQADIGIVAGPFAGHAEVESIPLGRRKLMAFMGQDHPLAGRASLGVADLAGLDLVLMADNNPMRALVQQAFAAAGAPLRPKLEAFTQRSAALMALLSGSLALIDQELAAELVRQDSQIRIADFTATPAWDVVAVRSRAKPATLVAEAALAQLKSAMAESSA